MPGSDSDEEDDPYLKRIKLEKETDSEDSLGGRIVYSKSKIYHCYASFKKSLPNHLITISNITLQENERNFGKLLYMFIFRCCAC